MTTTNSSRHAQTSTGYIDATCVLCGSRVQAAPGDFPEPMCADLDACRDDLADQALSAFGKDRQLLALAEECNELSAKILRSLNGKAKPEEITEEICDVLSTARSVWGALTPGGIVEAEAIARKKLRKLRAVLDRSTGGVPARV